jgi:hypothetical protein
MTDFSHLWVEIVPGDWITVCAEAEVHIELVKKSGKRVRLRISAPCEVRVKKITSREIPAPSMAS